MTSTAVALCVQNGWLEPTSRVRDFWPELPVDVTVEQLLSHQAGLITIEPRLDFVDLLDWGRAVAALEHTEPVWEPGTRHRYHAVTFGWLAGELVRRVDPKHRSLGGFVADEITAPLNLELWIGLPAEFEARVGRLYPPAPPNDPAVAAAIEALMGPSTLGGRSLSVSGGLDVDDLDNSVAFHAAEFPAANGITNARSLARLYGALVDYVDGIRLLNPDIVDMVRRQRVSGPDACLLIDTTFGLGYMLNSTFAPMLGRGSFGHPGYGGSVAFADPESGVGFAYVMNQLQVNLAGDPRPAGLIAAVRDCL